MAVPNDDRDSQTLEESVERLTVAIDTMIADRVKDAQRLNRIAMVLRAFYLSDVSAATLQPILALAVELNPGLQTDLQRLKAVPDPPRVM